MAYPMGADHIQLSSGPVGLTPGLMAIVDHPLFQRLKQLEQLEYVSFIYPSARHTRFEHSLETYKLTKTFIERLLQFPEFRLAAKPSYILAALLHDVGHYPLSHMFEDFATAKEKIGDVPVPTDEDMFYCLVGNASIWPYEKEINRRLKQLHGEDFLWSEIDSAGLTCVRWQSTRPSHATNWLGRPDRLSLKPEFCTISLGLL